MNTKIVNYMLDTQIQAQFDKWINSPTLLDHTLDRERFYRFVKYCVKFARRKVRNKPIASILKADLFKMSLIEKYKIRYSVNLNPDIVSQAVILFPTLVEYENTPLIKFGVIL
jgi:hypothetical protein